MSPTIPHEEVFKKKSAASREPTGPDRHRNPAPGDARQVRLGIIAVAVEEAALETLDRLVQVDPIGCAPPERGIRLHAAQEPDDAEWSRRLGHLVPIRSVALDRSMTACPPSRCIQGMYIVLMMP